ncbi:hypothetical protein D4A92_14755 [Rhizobium rosettiformans]|uniref:DUF945 domain-containing protein n=1 Tax=Rhizobium rosettiformans TaxID=1368430 RepID=A0ABX7EX61_9HYPH|nr:hypothetical protein [Rhizobium rosettiformans]QRF52601.1 hypothetical protein D4A92_14755 [Rhizobium rosettiformans]
MTLYRSTRLLLASAALTAFTGPAFALDGQDLLKKINAAFATGGSNITAENVEVDGSNVVLKGLKLGVEGATAEKPLMLEELTLEGVTEEEGGAYFIERVEFPEVNVTEEKSSFKVQDLYLAGVYVPGDANAEGIDSLMFYEEAHSGPVEVTVDGKSVFSMAEAVGTMGLSDDESTITFEGSVTGVKADLSTVEDPQAKAQIEALGLTTLDGNMNMSGSWEVESGTIDIEDYSIDFANVGKLSLAFSMSGYTLDLVKQMQEQARMMQAQPQNEQAQQAAGLAMLGLVQQLSLVDAQIRFEDAGITKRGLDYAGKSQGTDGAQMAQMVKGMLPILLAQAKLGAIQNEISAAVNTYIDDPKALTIAAAPANPVAFPMIMGAAMGAPETIPGLIGLKVTAND